MRFLLLATLPTILLGLLINPALAIPAQDTVQTTNRAHNTTSQADTQRDWQDFSKSCGMIRMLRPHEDQVGPMVLEAVCKGNHYTWITRQRLGDCLQNVDGGLRTQQGGKASATCRKCDLLVNLKDTMFCECDNGKGGWKWTAILLDLFVGNDDGWLVCRGAGDPFWGHMV